MIVATITESEKKRDIQVVKMAEKTVINAMKMCVVETRDEPVLSTVTLAIRLVIG